MLRIQFLRRSLLSPVLALLLGCLAVFAVSTARADDDATKKSEKKSSLPIQTVVLFNAGVGFFEHRADVEGDASIDLQFNIEDINDLLKSMVLQDLGGGKISTVTYTSKDPITKTLKTFAIDLTDNPTLANILGQARGEKVEVEIPDKLTGTIIGVEKRKHRVRAGDDEVIEIDVLNLLTEKGLKALPLEQVSSIRFLDEKLDGEFRQALALLATAHSTDKKTVTLKFTGEGRRPVRVGYVQASPIWKTSYRLVLRDKESPLLQGWAIVENTTEEDWNDVNLTLVSGRPVSFQMDLYEPLYVNRPRVEPELFASLRPQKYGQDLAARDEEKARFAGDQNESLARGGRAKRQSLGVAMGGAMAPAAPAPGEAAPTSEVAMDAAYFASTAPSAAQAGDVGELFQYVIDTPVTLERQRSAMLPIVNGPIEAKKVSIYNPNVQAKHPLNGLKLKNTTELHLMQGPITVFDGGTYAGDAQFDDLQPGSERLVSYALDLNVEVSQEQKAQPEQLTSVKITKGVLESTRKYERTVEYTIKNSSGETKTVLIEYPYDANWKLVEPKEASEKTRDTYRFEVEVASGKTVKFPVVEEMVASQLVAIADLDPNMLQFYISSSGVSDKVKKALAEVVRQRTQLQTIATQRQQKEGEIQTISQEQTRIRDNMAQLPRDNELYRRYVKKFGEQEDQVEALRNEIKKLTEEETRLRQELDRFLANLNLEK